LEADAWHLRTDVFTSLGILAGLSAIEIGRLAAPSTPLDFIDPACALAVSLLIVRTGAKLAWDSVSTLVDNRLAPGELLLISDHIQAFHPDVLSWRRLRTRRAGPFRMVIVDLVVDGSLSVSKAHALGIEVVRSIRRHFPGADVTFHLEPAEHADLPDDDGLDGPDAHAAIRGPGGGAIGLVQPAGPGEASGPGQASGHGQAAGLEPAVPGEAVDSPAVDSPAEAPSGAAPGAAPGAATGAAGRAGGIGA
jgi:hypothetical protein